MLLVVLTSVGLGVCMTAAGEGARLPCCPDFGGEAAFTVCCGAGEHAAMAAPAVAIYVPAPPAPAIAVILAEPVARDAAAPWRRTTRDIAYRSANPQALLSTFLL